MLLKTTMMSEEDYRTFSRPAVYDSLRRMLKFYGLESTAQIYYNGRNEIAKLIGSDAGEGARSDLYTDGTFRNKLFVVAEFEDSPFNSGYGNQRREITERPVWMHSDPKPMMMYPSFSGRAINVSVVAHFNSMKSADQFRRRINRAQAAQVVDFNFSATVHMVVNNSVIAMMANVHRLLVKNQDPNTPVEFGDWFAKYRRVPFMHVADAAGNNPRLVVPMRLDNIGITFKEPTVKQSRNADVYGKYEVELSYMFHFQEFVGWELEYPLNVYQDEIDPEWIGRPDAGFTQKFNVRVNPEMSMGKALTDTRKYQAPYYLKLPLHDPWVMPSSDWIQPVLQVRLTVKDEPQQVLGNIFEIPGFRWNDRVKAYILRRRDIIFLQFKSPFLVTVWSEDLQVLPERLTMDENGVVSISAQVNMKNKYRMLVCIDHAVRDYLESFWDDLQNNPDDEAILPTLFPGFDWPQLEKPWANHADTIRRGIHKGRGLPGEWFNAYMMNMGLNAYLIEDVRDVVRYRTPGN